jgi:WD40 repeat protein
MNKQDFICDLNKCKLYLEDPIILSCCWSTVCKEHENDYLDKNDDKFKCPICNQRKTIPQNGFVISTNRRNLIKNGDHLGEIQKKMLNSIAKLEAKIKEYKSINSEETIYDYFANIRNQLDLHREQQIEQINNESNEIILNLALIIFGCFSTRKYQAQIDLYRLQIIDKIHEKSEELLAFLKIEEEKCKEKAVIKNFMLEDSNTQELSSWKNQLRNPDFQKEEATILLNQINDKINQINYDISNNAKDLSNKIKDKFNQTNNDIFGFKNYVKMKKKIEFFPSQFDNYLGDIEFNTNNFKISNDFGKLIKYFNHHKVNSIQVLEDANKLISTSSDNSIKIWNMRNGKCLKTLNEHSGTVTCVIIYNNNKFISGSWDDTIKIWDLESFECIETLNNNSGVTSLLLLSDEILASCSWFEIKIWNLSKKIIKKSIRTEGWIDFLTKTKDSSKLITGSLFDSKIEIWDSNNCQLLKELNGHSEEIRCLKMLNDETFLSGSRDNTIKIWKIYSGECLKTLYFNNWVNCIETFNDDKMLIIGSESDVIIYDLNKYEEVRKMKYEGGRIDWVSDLILLSNGNLLTSSFVGEIKIWNLLEPDYELFKRLPIA